MEAYRSRSGSEVRYRPDGRVGVVRSGNMTIVHNSTQTSRIVVQRVDRTVIVTNRSGHGYIQRPFEYRGHELVNRTYYVRGQSYTRYYNPYRYNGVVLHAYVPVRYYNPGFYGWFSIGWGAPVYYPWGWVRDPWYGYYRGYFTPYPYYSSPGFWLTDYIISTRLAEAYSERAAAAAGGYYDGDVRLSPEVKDSIAREVERQLAAERAEADALARNEMPDPQGGFPRMLADGNPHVFVVSYNLDVIDSSGQSCSVGRGDVLQLSAPPPPDAVAALLQVVASSRPGGCRVGARVTVGLEDLQDIYNQMRETLSQGVEELRMKSGQNGVPALPPGVGMAPQNASYVVNAPPPDAQVATELSREAQNAERVELEVTNEAASDPEGRSTAPPVTVSLGQTIDEVVAALGNPRQIVNAGNKQVYVYPKLKITFRNGRVADVE